MSDSALIVPIGLDALVVNRAVLGRDIFRWWPYGYAALGVFGSPEPEALQGGISQQQPGVYLHWTLPAGLRHGTRDPRTGEVRFPLVPNRWLVTRFSGAGPRRARAWVIEADCPDGDSTPQPQPMPPTSYLLDADIAAKWASSADPQRQQGAKSFSPSGPSQLPIGISFPLDSWSERDPKATFLTAVAPGNHLFTAYVQHCFNIFAFRDPLDDIGDDPTLSYQVVGWYSDPAADILASWASAEDPDKAWNGLLGDLGWTTADASVRATTSLYQGMAFAVPWEAQGDAPPVDALVAAENTPLNVGVGNNITDAFTGLLNKQLPANGHDTGSLTLLKAFNYDLLPVLNQVNGAALLDWKVRQSWFGSKPGGNRWTLTPPPAGEAPPPPLTPEQTNGLVSLNQASAALDTALGTLADFQWRLHGEWWKRGKFAKLPGLVQRSLQPLTDAVFLQELNLSNAAGVAAQTVAQMNLARPLIAKVPQPIWNGSATAQEALQKGIAAFSGAQGFPSGYQLKAVPQPRYWRPSDPAIVIAGLDAPPPQPETVTARPASTLVTALTVDGGTATASACAAAIPAVDARPGMPAELPQMMAEFFLLDPASAPAIAAAAGLDPVKVAAAVDTRAGYAGTLPSQPLAPWTGQPWQPLMLEWAASYSDLPFDTAGWQFDGTDYQLPAAPAAAPDTRSLSGICVLGPAAQFVFKGRLEKFLGQQGSSDPDATALGQLDQWIEQIDGWKFLGQELTGFNDLLAMRDPRPYRRPGLDEMVSDSQPAYPIDALTGYTAAAGTGDPYALPEPQSGQVHSVPYIANGPSPVFRGARHGQFHLTDLYIYDKFGRVLKLIASGRGQGLYTDANFPLAVDGPLKPTVSVQPNIVSVLQVPPRILQHGRLDIDLVDRFDDGAVLGLSAGVNPVCGWVLPNHLDGSLSLYGPDGVAMGEYRLVVGDSGIRTGEWQAPVRGMIDSLDDVATVSPHLAGFLASPALATEAAFEALLAATDETLWTIDPLGSRGDQNLSVLVGRPLALVRARMALRLDGPPHAASDWAATGQAQNPPFLAYRFPVRLGDQATRQDGTIGYFLNDDYDSFNSVAAPEEGGEAQSYVNQIGPLGSATSPGGQNYVPLSFRDGDSALLTLLVDPRASVHAISGILPVKQLEIPSEFVDPALARIEVGFRIGPLLTPLLQSPAEGGREPAFATSVSYPAPAERNGRWSWWEPQPDESWTGLGVVAATPAAMLGRPPNQLREGMLQLALAMKNDRG